LILLNSKRVTPEKKVDVMGMTYAVIMKSKDAAEAERCLEHMLPAVVYQAQTAKERDVRQASKNFIRRTLESKELGESAMEAFAKGGVGSDNSKISIECCKATPDIFDNRNES
jgi:hypothetical protein